MARALMHLRYLRIRNCQAMEEVVVKEEKEAEDKRRILPQLRDLILGDLPKLRSFFQMKHGLDLSLDALNVYGCPELGPFSWGSLSKPKLKAYVQGKVWVHNLNTKEYVEARKGEASEGEASEAKITKGFEFVPASLEESSMGPIVLDQSSQSSEQGPLVPLGPKCLSLFQDVKIQFPEVIRPIIDDVIHAERDGHCGFHVVANFMKFKDNGWKKVRNDLLDELEKTDYSEVFFGAKHVAELKLSTQCEDATVDEKHWMIMPDMGYVIASHYDIVVVFISSGQCLTFLPLRKEAPPETSHPILGIGYINENHFVGLTFKPDSPLPPVSERWRNNREELAKGWITPYENRMEKFRDMVKNTNVAISDI